MNVPLVKFVDKFIGSLVCLFLGIYSELYQLLTKRNFQVQNILIVRLWAVGETILIMPMVQELKKRFPKAKITVLTTPNVRKIFECTDIVDEIIEWTPGIMLRYINKFDIAIDTEPYLCISAISSFFMAKERIGFANRIRSLLYTVKVKFNDNQHEVLTFMDMVKQLGIDYIPKNLVRLKVKSETTRWVEEYLKEKDAKLPLIGICAGSADSATVGRRWPGSRFATVADKLIDKYKATIIFIGTTKEKTLITKAIKGMRNPAINAAGDTNLEQLFYLIENCSLFISNDTGPMHIAATQGVPTIGLFGPNLPTRFAPYGEDNIALYMKMYCSPCINVHKGEIKNCDKPMCMEMLTVESVMEAAKQLLQ